MPSTVVIQIIGLVLLSYQIESGHLLAVAPRIPCPPSPDTRWKAGSAEQAMLEAGVEEHATTLEFAASDFVSVSGWTTEYVDPPSNTTMRIRLDGDHLRFVPSPFRREQTAKIQATQSDPNDLGLPHLGCCRHPQLRPEYMPPSYRLAAVVADLSGGRARGCDQPTERSDTVVDIDNGGTVTIIATNATDKQLVVHGNAQLKLQNMPVGPSSSCYQDPNPPDGLGPGHGAGGDHRRALIAMVASCVDPGPCPARRKGHCTEPLPSIDARCSNNQWP